MAFGSPVADEERRLFEAGQRAAARDVRAMVVDRDQLGVGKVVPGARAEVTKNRFPAQRAGIEDPERRQSLELLRGGKRGRGNLPDRGVSVRVAEVPSEREVIDVVVRDGGLLETPFDRMYREGRRLLLPIQTLFLDSRDEHAIHEQGRRCVVAENAVAVNAVRRMAVEAREELGDTREAVEAENDHAEATCRFDVSCGSRGLIVRLPCVAEGSVELTYRLDGEVLAEIEPDTERVFDRRKQAQRCEARPVPERREAGVRTDLLHRRVGDVADRLSEELECLVIVSGFRHRAQPSPFPS